PPGRPISQAGSARPNRHVLFGKEKGGDENSTVWRRGLAAPPAPTLPPTPAVFAYVLGMHREDPHLIAVGMNDRDPRWHDVYVVDIRSGERTLVYENADEIASFILDHRLNLRLATTTKNKGAGSAILKWSGAAFEEIISIEEEDALSTHPLFVNRAADAWYLASSIGRDKSVMLRVDWASGAQTLVASHDKVDIAGVTTDPRTDEVTAVSAEYIRSEWIPIDPATGRDLATLERELDADVDIASQSDDDTLWVVTASRPDRSSAWHLLDRRTGEHTFLFAARPKLDQVKLAPMHGVVIRARDGLELVSYFTLPANETGTRPAQPLPMVLDVHGGPWWRD